VIYEKTGCYTPDFADEIDKPDEIIADRYGVNIITARLILKDQDDAVTKQQASILGAVIGQLIAGNNIRVKVHALAIAYGFDQLNGFHSQSEIAKELGCTRALISHYVTGWRDILAGGIPAFDCLKFRKGNKTRNIYRDKATSKTLSAKKKIQTDEHN
jgi:hypothetical protein